MATYPAFPPSLLSDDLSTLLPASPELLQALLDRQDAGNAAIAVFVDSLASGLLPGGAGADAIAAGTGNHVLVGYAGDDSLHGGAGWNLLFGGSGDDVLDVRWLSDPQRGGLTHDDWSAA